MTPAKEYIKGVLAGDIVVGKWVRLAVERHERDLEHQDDEDWPYYFDPEAATRPVEFCHAFCKHSKGREWAGESFIQEPWQQFIDWALFGWLRKEDGMRRFKVAYLQMGRKNGKTTKGAATGNYMLVADGEPGADCYTCATKRDQARLSHGEATRMVRSSPELRKRVKVYKDNLNVEETASRFEPLGADADSMDGLNLHFGLADEVHAWKKRLMWDLLDTATASRTQPILYAITTPGVDHASFCYTDLYLYGCQVLDPNSPIEDDTFFAFIAAIDEGDDAFDETVWPKANPNLGVSVKIDDLRRKAHKAKALPSALNAFLRLHMGLWVRGEVRWLPMDDWARCAETVDETALEGKRCFGGLDLASVRDLTAFVMVFPPKSTGDKYIVVPRFWVPEDSLLERFKHVPAFEGWFNEGWAKATPGNVADYNVIQADILALWERYDIAEVPYDRWGAAQLTQNLSDAGMTVVPFGQGYASMSAPAKELERFLLSGEINPGVNPVLQWNAECAIAKVDPAGNVKPDKEASNAHGKIDGIVALIMGLDRAIRHEEEEVPTPGLLVL